MMNDMELVKFDPSIEQLQAIVAATSQITAIDLSDDKQLAIVHENRISLRDARVKIEKSGKEYRAEALSFQKAVIAREKELIAIIEPEEQRLKTLEEEANKVKERVAREALLPMRKEMLAKIGIESTDDDKILDLDNDEFVAMLNDLTAKKNEADRLALEAEKAKLADDARIAQVKKDAEIAERNRIEAANKADEERRIQEADRKEFEAQAAAQKILDDAKTESDRVIREAHDKLDQEMAQAEAAARELAVREQQAKDEAAKKEAQAKFLAWAQGCGWDGTASGYKTAHTTGGIELWKLVGTYTE